MLHSSRLHLQGTFAPSRDFRRHPDLFSLPIPIFDKADVVVEGNYYVGRQPYMPIEPDVGYVYHDDNGKLVIHSKSIGIHLHLYMIAPGLGVEPENLVLIQNNAGGTFGYKCSPTMEALVRRGTIRLLHQSFTERKSQILYPVFADRRGHPPLLATNLIPIINGEHQPEGGLRTLLAQIEAEQPEQVREIQVADSNIHFDMDTREDYISGCLRLNRCDIPTMAECEVILEHLHPMPEKGWAHGRRVAEVAMALCEAIIRQSGCELDPEDSRKN